MSHLRHTCESHASADALLSSSYIYIYIYMLFLIGGAAGILRFRPRCAPYVSGSRRAWCLCVVVPHTLVTLAMREKLVLILLKIK